jgi:anthranilate phosphoribosyltransferase
MLTAILDQLVRREDLTAPQAEALVRALASEDASPALAGAILAALRTKGEAPAEIEGFARGLRALAARPDIPHDIRDRALDIVGTGGDSSGTFNLSTAAALVCAAAGVPIIKHGNRAITSKSGSADVLAELGLPMPMDAATAARCLQRTGFTFLFAPHYHAATARIAGIRRALGVRTIFNLLGPLTNPAQPRHALLGAYAPDAARHMARACAALGSPCGAVVHADDGSDEPTPACAFTVVHFGSAGVREERVDPVSLGLPRCAADDLKGGDAAHNARALRRLAEGERSAHRDAVVLGAGLALHIAGAAQTRHAGLQLADRVIADGRLAALLGALAAFGRGSVLGGGEHG